MTPEQVLWAVSLGLIASAAVALWLLRDGGWLTARLDRALAGPLS